MQRILIVEDDEAPAEMATKVLKDAFNCEVDLARSPNEGIARLHRNSYDVALVDMLFRSHSLEFLQRHSSRKVELSDSVLHQSGLAVLRAIQKNKFTTKPILWTFGDANRYLHIIFAYEELGCRVFCTKDNIRNLPEAVNRAAVGKEHRDSLLVPVSELEQVRALWCADEGTPGRSDVVEAPLCQEFRCYRARSPRAVPPRVLPAAAWPPPIIRPDGRAGIPPTSPTPSGLNSILCCPTQRAWPAVAADGRSTAAG